ncbi:MarR family winged helix-turn-helix transcriptional regulator [Rarobacter incanus]|uniref:MarR family transcriptional regulator n=1 Tax=Rarobacter incanus TaxID=153494 RepID=A0A542SQ32_9MICO|nr:MarR family transcriptional regulator [Rarobacter incanus]TQK76377.1 MarR family transcriptional regulator [Rarobacter incanus]
MNDVRWLSAQELHTWVKLEVIAELLPAALDQPLQRDHNLNHFEYIVLAQLSESDRRTMPLTVLAARTSATLPRLSHVIRRLEDRGLVVRSTSELDRRVTLATLTDAGWDLVVRAAPTHVASVRDVVIDRLTPDQLRALDQITDAMLEALDPGDRKGLRQACGEKAPAPDGV